MATAVSVSATNNSEIDGLLAGVKWSGTITYSFPDASSDYVAGYGSGEPTATGFSQAPSQMQAAINYAVSLILGYTNATIQYAGTNGADLMIAQSSAANPTSYAYYPGNYAEGGDVWFGTAYNYSLASLGNYYFTTALHELGHALGLKHSQETGGVANVAVPTAHDDLEYTLMSYRSYVGGPLTGYTNEAYGYPQTYMANDILALQTMYGANYTTHSESTVYTWSATTGQEFIDGVAQLAPGGGAGGSANRIFETIWDGGGVDTYDLSNYTTNLTLNLNPGAVSLFSATQLAYLGDGHYASGNLYNAYLYNGDARSYIDNAIGGSGNDTIIGNAIANVLNGGGGNDTITGGGGNDTIIGGAGTDTAVYSGNRANYGVAYNSGTQTFTVTDLRGGSPDGTDTDTGIEYFQFADGTISSATLISQLTPVVIEAIGTTSLVQSGGYYFLNPTAGGTGPTAKYLGGNITVGQWGAWAPIGAEATASGYQVAWKLAGADQYTVWNTDANGNDTVNVTGTVSGSSTALESLETSFHQDLNGDGIIGLPSITIEALGSTALVQLNGLYYLNPVAGGTGPTLKYLGADITVGQWGGWTPIGAEGTANGYQVAWKLAGADQYTVWNTDANGNDTVNVTGTVSGGSTALESLETSFHQDLNGDGIIGLPTSTTIEAFGSTVLVQSGNVYHLNPVAGGTGPTLKYLGADITVGQWGGWAPIGAEVTASGYQVAWKLAGADQYTVWNTDANGNDTVNVTGTVSGGSTALESLETSFHQDLNGDGIIGLPAPIATSTTIEAFGSTALVQSNGVYYLNPAAGGTGPTLKYGGVNITVGQWNGWAPIGAEATASGYQVAWKLAGADQYTVWNTDANGNDTVNVTGTVSGNSIALESLESSFHQDLNGDGAIGAPAATGTAMGGFLFQPVSTVEHSVTDASWPWNPADTFAKPLPAVSDPSDLHVTQDVGVHVLDLHAIGFLIS